MLFTTAVLAALVAKASAVKTSRTFAVLHHYGGGPLVTTRVDPLVNPGVPATHLHTVMGASGFSMDSTGQDLRKSSCTTALIKEDLSAYWFPSLFFQDPLDGHFEPVELFYTNMYYFFEATNDDIKSFPLGLRMLSGSAATRAPPNTNGTVNLDAADGAITPLQWTCPRGNFNPPSWPAGSDGTNAGIQDPNNKGSGFGFPFANCDGYAAPLRMDLHFPSCYNPAAGLENYKTNTVFPADAGGGKHDCPKGWIHTPHLFFEVYWNTPKFLSRWTPNSGKQPFVLSNGDRTGNSGHGDFISGWNEQTLQQMIDNCDAGTSGMDKCPGLLSGLNDRSGSCTIASPVDEQVTGKLAKLPGNNPVSGWGVGTDPVSNPSSGSSPASSSGSGSSPASSSGSASSPASSSGSASSPAASSGSGSSSSSSPSAAASSPSSADSSATPTSPNTKIADPSTTSAPTTIPDGDDGQHSTSTTWETIVEYQTTTVFADDAPSATDAAVIISAETISKKADVAGFKYAGCFKDDKGRTLDGEIRPNLGQMTNDLCVTHCKAAGFALAGTEYGGQCYCGNELDNSAKQNETVCNMACEGNASQTCGGGWALSVYSTDGSAKLTRKSNLRRTGHNHGHLHAHRRSGPSARLRR